MAGKGSGRRPQQVDQTTFSKNWEKAFDSPKKESEKFWVHDCPFYQNKPLWTLTDHPCNWCDAKEYK